MSGKNWNSKPKKWSDLVKPETKENAIKAMNLRKSGKTVKEIALKLELSIFKNL